MNIFKSFAESKVMKNAGWLIGGNIIQKIIVFIFGIWIARYLGPSNYGLINYSSAYLTFFYSIATLGINSVIVKRFIDEPEQEGTTLGTTLVLQAISSLMSVIMIFLIVLVVDFGETITIAVVFLSSLGLFFQVLDSVKYWFQSKLQSKYVSIATIIAYIITSLYKIILLILNKSVLWFAFASSIDYTCVAVVLFIVYKRDKGPRLRFSMSVAKELWSAGHHYILSGLMVAVYGATDKIMLKHMLNEQAVGFYGMAVSIANIWVFVLAAIIDSFNPVIMELYNRDKTQFRIKNIQLYSIVFYLSVAVSLAMTLFADFGINLLYGDAYQGAVAPLKIVNWYVAFSYLGVARNAWVVCEGHQKYLKYIYFGSAFTNVILNFILIPNYGASGAAMASLITQMSSIVLFPLFIKSMRPNAKLMIDAISYRLK